MAETAEKKDPRKRVTVPPVDTSVHDWWSMQHDPSLSVRLLIRQDIERMGYRDVAYGHVERLARPGRPASGTRVATDVESDQEGDEPRASLPAGQAEAAESADDGPRDLASVGAAMSSSDESPAIASLMGM